MNVFDLMAKISLDKSEYSKGMSEASEEGRSTASKIGSTLKTTGKVAGATLLAVGTAVTALTKKTYDGMKATAEYGDVIDKTSQKLGVSAKTYQEYDYVMNLAGTSMQDMTTGMKTLTNQLDEAINGGDKATANFQKLGISMDELKNMSREDLFKKTIERLQQMEDSTERASLANDLFGKSGQNLTPLFNMTNAETAELITNLNQMGGVMSDEAVKASADFNDALTTLNVGISAIKNGAMSELLPATTEIIEGLTALFTGDDTGLGKIQTGVEDLANKLLQKLPKFADFGSKILMSLATAIIDNLPTLMDSATKIVMELANQIIIYLPTIVQAGLEAISSFAMGIGEALPSLIPTIVDVMIQIVDTLADNADMIVDGAFALMEGLGKGLIKALPTVIQKVPVVIGKLVTAFGTRILSEAKSIGSNLLKGLWNGISDGWNWLLNKVGELSKALLNKVKGILGIHSPSKAFAEIGEYCAEGFNEGMDDLLDSRSIASNINSGLGSIKRSINVDASVGSGSASDSLSEYCRKTLEIMSDYLPQIANMQMVTDTGMLVGALAPQMDAQLGIIAQRKARG